MWPQISSLHHGGGDRKRHRAQHTRSKESPTHVQWQGEWPWEKEHPGAEYCQPQDTYFYQAACRGDNPAAAGWPKRLGRAGRESHEAK